MDSTKLCANDPLVLERNWLAQYQLRAVSGLAHCVCAGVRFTGLGQTWVQNGSLLITLAGNSSCGT